MALPPLDLKLALGGQTTTANIATGASSGVGPAPTRRIDTSVWTIVGAVVVVIVVGFLIIKNMGRGK